MKLAAARSLFLAMFLSVAPAQADLLCVSKTAKVNKKGQLPLGAQMFVRAACRSNEVPVLNTSLFIGPKGEKGIGGALGTQGPKGDAGAVGPQGLKGDTGAVGPKGDPGPGVSWVEASSATQMEANIGYIVTGGRQVDLTLPTSLAVGDIVQIRGGRQRTLWRILPGVAGQVVQGYEGIASAGAREWRSIAASSDGQRLVATTLYGGSIYISKNAGISWTESSGSGQRSWGEIASSGDGMKLVTSAGGNNGGYGSLFTSIDGGETWTERSGAGVGHEWQVASSTDGTRLVAAAQSDNDRENPGSFLYTSQDGGVSWTKQESAGTGEWSALASSGDGIRLTAARFNYDSNTYSSETTLTTSSDSGLTWTSKVAPAGFKWQGFGLASSSDGLNLVTILASPVNGAYAIAISTDGGESWVRNQAAGEKLWSEVVSSADGQTLYASAWVEGEVEVYRSTNGGSSWGLVFNSADYLSSLSTNSGGSTFYGITSRPNSGTFLFSSDLTALTEVKGYGQIKLIYLGENTFGVQG
jgi:hypothetical protein